MGSRTYIVNTTMYRLLRHEAECVPCPQLWGYRAVPTQAVPVSVAARDYSDC